MTRDDNSDPTLSGRIKERVLTPVEQAFEAMRHYPQLFQDVIPTSFYHILAVPPQPNFIFNTHVEAWIDLCRNETLVNLSKQATQRWETQSILDDRIFIGVPLSILCETNQFPDEVGIEVYQACLSVLNVIIFTHLRFSDEPQSLWPYRFSYRKFLSRIRSGERFGISAELYEHSLRERMNIILNILGIPGIEEFLRETEPHLLGYIRFVNRWYNRNRPESMRTSIPYENMILMAALLCIMHRDKLIKHIPEPGEIVDREHRIWPPLTKQTSLRRVSLKKKRKKR